MSKKVRLLASVIRLGLSAFRRKDLVKEAVKKKIVSEGATGFLTQENLVDVLSAKSELEEAKDKFAAVEQLVKSAEDRSKAYLDKQAEAEAEADSDNDGIPDSQE